MRGCFVTATDTGVGKTVLAAALAAGLATRGLRGAAYKPVVTGIDDPQPGVAPDHELLAAVTGQDPVAVAPQRFGPPVSPHLAAGLVGRELVPAELIAAASRAAADVAADALIVEGVGGLLVPLSERWLVRDLAVALGLPLVIAARPGLGTINHTLLTLAAAGAAGLEVRAVVMTPWPREPDAMLRSNRDTIARLGAVEVATLAPLSPASVAELAAAGAALDPERFLGAPASDRVAA